MIVRSAARTGSENSRPKSDIAPRQTTTSWKTASDGRHAALQVEPRREIDEDADQAEEHGVDRLELELLADLRPDELHAADLDLAERRHPLASACSIFFATSCEDAALSGRRTMYSRGSPNSWMMASPIPALPSALADLADVRAAARSGPGRACPP